MTAIHTRTVSPGTRTPLQAARSQRGLSQEALAYRAGICVATLRRVERGLVTPTRGTRRLLAIALGLDEQLIFAEQSEAPARTGAPRQVAGRGDYAAG